MSDRDKVMEVFAQNLNSIYKKYTNSDTLPELLYHYTKFDNLEKIVKHRKLRLSIHTKLDDILEIEHAKKITLEIVEERLTISIYKEFWNDFLNNFSDINIFNYYIFSMTDRYNDEYMWEKYGDSGKGISIGISTEFFTHINLCVKKYKRFICFQKVNYNDEDFKKYLNELFIKFESILSENPLYNAPNYYKHLKSELYLYIFAILAKIKRNIGKDNSEYFKENEWRIFQISYLKEFNKSLPKKGRLALATKEGHTEINIGPKFIKEIWLGNENMKTYANKILKTYRINGAEIKKV